MKIKEMFKAFFKKQLENLSSAKMLMFFLPFIVTSVFMYIIIGKCFVIGTGLISLAGSNAELLAIAVEVIKLAATTFTAFCTFTVSLGGTIIVCREVFKVQKLTALSVTKEEETEKKRKIEDIGV